MPATIPLKLWDDRPNSIDRICKLLCRDIHLVTRSWYLKNHKVVINERLTYADIHSFALEGAIKAIKINDSTKYTDLQFHGILTRCIKFTICDALRVWSVKTRNELNKEKETKKYKRVNVNYIESYSGVHYDIPIQDEILIRGLTKQEYLIANLLNQGCTMRNIGLRLGYSESNIFSIIRKMRALLKDKINE